MAAATSSIQSWTGPTVTSTDPGMTSPSLVQTALPQAGTTSLSASVTSSGFLTVPNRSSPSLAPTSIESSRKGEAPMATETVTVTTPPVPMGQTTTIQSTTIGANGIATVFSYTAALRAAGEASATSSTGKPGGGASSGAIAGAAVGAAVGAALIAFLLTFSLCVRKRRTEQRGGVFMTEKPSPAHAWDAFLPQSADDGTIQRSVNALYSQIDMHVENYYSSNAMASISAESRAALQKVDGGTMSTSIEELMRKSTTPLPIIKHCFAYTILSRLSPTAQGEHSLLPPELGRLPPKRIGSKGKGAREDQAMGQAYPYWRMLTAHLLYPRASDAANSLHPHGTEDVARLLRTAFQAWGKDPRSGASASEHVRSVLRTATEAGLLILSQPSTFKFEWDVLDTASAAPGTIASTVVILPAFEKTADERGEPLTQKYVLAKPKVEAISF
ncbi:hypothetical protein AC579_933 [Pseudocercospora musae]|uniref:Uncharacterized protein n=1 Tax=Pseudocercospora musae TaxID=113226 RepID=A0A139IUA8_9PEZI|nr:hypothetical protein AC579_933 [Pseudocercospora musae]